MRETWCMPRSLNLAKKKVRSLYSKNLKLKVRVPSDGKVQGPASLFCVNWVFLYYHLWFVYSSCIIHRSILMYEMSGYAALTNAVL